MPPYHLSNNTYYYNKFRPANSPGLTRSSPVLVTFSLPPSLYIQNLPIFLFSIFTNGHFLVDFSQYLILHYIYDISAHTKNAKCVMYAYLRKSHITYLFLLFSKESVPLFGLQSNVRSFDKKFTDSTVRKLTVLQILKKLKNMSCI